MPCVEVEKWSTAGCARGRRARADRAGVFHSPRCQGKCGFRWFEDGTAAEIEIGAQIEFSRIWCLPIGGRQFTPNTPMTFITRCLDARRLESRSSHNPLCWDQNL